METDEYKMTTLELLKFPLYFRNCVLLTSTVLRSDFHEKILCNNNILSTKRKMQNIKNRYDCHDFSYLLSHLDRHPGSCCSGSFRSFLRHSSPHCHNLSCCCSPGFECSAESRRHRHHCYYSRPTASAPQNYRRYRAAGSSYCRHVHRRYCRYGPPLQCWRCCGAAGCYRPP